MTSSPETAPRPTFARDAWIVIAGQSFSTIGDSMLLIVLPLMVLDLTQSPLHVGLVVAVAEVPAMLGFLSGWPRRHVRAQPLLILYDLTRGAVLLGMTGLVWTGNGSLAAIYVLSFLVNLMSTMFRPTRIEFITHVVPPDALRRFNSLDRTLETLAVAIGVGLGGFVYMLLPGSTVFAVCAATFVGSGLSLLTLKVPGGAFAGSAERVRTSFRAAIASVRRRPVMVCLIGGETLAGMSFGIYLTVFVVYAREFLGVSSATFGLFEMVQALAAAAGGVLMATGLIRLSDERLAVIGYLGMGLSLLVLSANALVWPVFLLMAAFGLANILYAIAVRTLLQSSSTEHELIHVFAAESTVSRAAQILCAAAAGALLGMDRGWMMWLLATAGVLTCISALWTYWTLIRRQVLPARTETTP